mgnify:CR=1 FL=1
METVATYNYDYKLRRINRLSQGMWWNIFYDQQDRMINETNELGYSMDYIYLEIGEGVRSCDLNLDYVN